MADENRKLTVHERWANLRFSVIGPLLAAPPARGELQHELRKLTAKQWLHPITAEPTQFGVSTIERWDHTAKRARLDPVGVLRRKLRKDSGQQPAMGEALKQALSKQYEDHRSWSYALHYDNPEVLAALTHALYAWRADPSDRPSLHLPITPFMSFTCSVLPLVRIYWSGEFACRAGIHRSRKLVVVE